MSQPSAGAATSSALHHHSRVHGHANDQYGRPQSARQIASLGHQHQLGEGRRVRGGGSASRGYMTDRSVRLRRPVTATISSPNSSGNIGTAKPQSMGAAVLASTFGSTASTSVVPPMTNSNHYHYNVS
jgi:hypothetical protein